MTQNKGYWQQNQPVQSRKLRASAGSFFPRALFACSSLEAWLLRVVVSDGSVNDGISDFNTSPERKEEKNETALLHVVLDGWIYISVYLSVPMYCVYHRRYMCRCAGENKIHVKS